MEFETAFVSFLAPSVLTFFAGSRQGQAGLGLGCFQAWVCFRLVFCFGSVWGRFGLGQGFLFFFQAWLGFSSGFGFCLFRLGFGWFLVYLGLVFVPVSFSQVLCGLGLQGRFSVGFSLVLVSVFGACVWASLLWASPFPLHSS